MNEREFAEALAALLEHGLIEHDDEGEGERFRPTSTGREYGAGDVDVNEEGSVTHD